MFGRGTMTRFTGVSANSNTLWISSSSVWSSTPCGAPFGHQVLDLLLGDERAVADVPDAEAWPGWRAWTWSAGSPAPREARDMK